MTPGFLAGATGRMDLPLVRMEKAVNRVDFEGHSNSSVLDMLSLRHSNEDVE